MPSYPAQQTRKYEVIRAIDGWVVERAGKLLACFEDAETAVAYACRAAREDARKGWLGIVSTQTTPQEFHCYTPADVRGEAPRPFPRLVSSR
jgi:hypothetical protein